MIEFIVGRNDLMLNAGEARTGCENKLLRILCLILMFCKSYICHGFVIYKQQTPFRLPAPEAIYVLLDLGAKYQARAKTRPKVEKPKLNNK